jgi:hypothetical protein
MPWYTTIAIELEISDLRLDICQLKLEWTSATKLETVALSGFRTLYAYS